MNFENILNESYMELEEASNPMTMEQKKTVQKFKRHGWKIYDRDNVKVIMMKEENGKLKEVFIYKSGKTFFIHNESEEHDITELVDIMLEEGVFDDITSFFKRAFDNLTTIALVRGKSTFLITMSRSKNEYVEMEDGQVISNGELSSRQAGKAFIGMLKESGYEETSFSSVIPRRITSSLKFSLRAAPTVLIAVLIYSYFPGASWVVNVLARGAWSVISNALLPSQAAELNIEMAAIANKVIGN